MCVCVWVCVCVCACVCEWREREKVCVCVCVCVLCARVRVCGRARGACGVCMHVCHGVVLFDLSRFASLPLCGRPVWHPALEGVLGYPLAHIQGCYDAVWGWYAFRYPEQATKAVKGACVCGPGTRLRVCICGPVADYSVLFVWAATSEACAPPASSPGCAAAPPTSTPTPSAEAADWSPDGVTDMV
ncbi:MAG: hypothetical protein P4L40_04945 [Terracidiphilus sp.]|nr:hypothetical protein [Terracidiphilus sp.]